MTILSVSECRRPVPCGVGINAFSLGGESGPSGEGGEGDFKFVLLNDCTRVLLNSGLGVLLNNQT